MGIDFEGLKNNDNVFGNRKGGFSRWKPSAGDNVIRILPPSLEYFETDIAYFTYVFNNHFVRLGKDQFEVFRCLRDSEERVDCPACTFFFKYRKDENDNVAKMASRFNSSVRHIMNILVVETESGDDSEGVQVYECGPGVYEDIKTIIQNGRYGDILDPEEGRNVIVNLTPRNAPNNNTNYNQYSVNPDGSPSDIRPLLPEDWKDKIDALEGHVADMPEVEYVERVVATAADLVDLDLPGTRKVRPATPVSPPSDSLDDEDEEIQLDDDDVLGEEPNEVDGEFDDLLDDEDLDF